MTNKELAEKIMANIDFVGHDCECKLEYKLGEGRYVPVDDGKIGYDPRAIADLTDLISAHTKAKDAEIERLRKIIKTEINSKQTQLENYHKVISDMHENGIKPPQIIINPKDGEKINLSSCQLCPACEYKDKRIAELEMLCKEAFEEIRECYDKSDYEPEIQKKLIKVVFPDEA